MMTAIPTLFKEVFLIKPLVHKDTRGSFREGYKDKDFSKAYRKADRLLSRQSYGFKKGVLRGLHYQLPPF